MTGQIDMSKPLIEQPEPAQLQEQHKKMIADMLLSPKSLNSTGSSNPQTSPNLRSSSPAGPQSSTSPQSSPLANIQTLMAGGASSNQDNNSDIMKNLLSKLTSTPNNQVKAEAESSSSPDFKNLLQNYGLDLVKQFSEMKRKTTESDAESESNHPESKRPNLSMNGRMGDESPSRAATPIEVDENKP